MHEINPYSCNPFLSILGAMNICPYYNKATKCLQNTLEINHLRSHKFSWHSPKHFSKTSLASLSAKELELWIMICLTNNRKRSRIIYTEVSPMRIATLMLINLFPPYIIIMQTVLPCSRLFVVYKHLVDTDEASYSITITHEEIASNKIDTLKQ